MSDSDAFEMNVKGLDQLIKAFGDKIPSVRVGVLGTNAARKDGSFTNNAEVGAAHEFGGGKGGGGKAKEATAKLKFVKSAAAKEFGSSELPQRSFLRMPLTDYLYKHLEDSNAFDKEALDKVVKEGSIASYIEKIGLVALTVVQEAFASRGFGKWKPSNMKRKKVKQTLVETQQLRDSIDYEVVQ